MSDQASPSLVAYCDGACRGNPGPASIGAVIYQEDARGERMEPPVREIAEAIGSATNNVAEYRSLIAALEAARDLHASRVRLFMDSELVVKQVKGIYRVKNAGLQPLHRKAKQLLGNFPFWELAHVRRADNSVADALANQALDAI